FVDLRIRVDDAFEHELRRSRHADPMFWSTYYFERRTKQAAGDPAFVDTKAQARRSRHHEERMRADHHRDGKRLLLLLRELQQPPEMPARVQAGRELGLRVQHRTVVAQV